MDIRALTLWNLGLLEVWAKNEITYAKLLKNHTDLVQYFYDGALGDMPEQARLLGRDKVLEIVEQVIKEEGY